MALHAHCIVHPDDIKFMLGTAWKADKTETITLDGLRSGAIAIDTANQPIHYEEEAVGRAIHEFLMESNRSRDELFLQSKFTFPSHQRDSVPYKVEGRTVEMWVDDSFDQSLSHLKTNWLDSYILHGLISKDDSTISEDDLKAFNAMVALRHRGKTRYIGVSNINADQLRDLISKGDAVPNFVQNRFLAVGKNWDIDVRDVCNKYNIVYQAFSIVNGNKELLHSKPIVRYASHSGVSPGSLFSKFASLSHSIVLNGSPNHLSETIRYLEKEEMDFPYEYILSLGIGNRESVSIQFQNFVDRPFQLYWLNDANERVDNGIIKEGHKEFILNTKHAHRFEFVDENDEIVVDFQVNQNQGLHQIIELHANPEGISLKPLLQFHHEEL